MDDENRTLADLLPEPWTSIVQCALFVGIVCAVYVFMLLIGGPFIDAAWVPIEAQLIAWLQALLR